MTIELVKELDNIGQVSYHVKVDGSFQSGTFRSQLHDAMEVYENVKANYSKARTEVLIKEEI
jgi:hypothetical protein